MTFFRFYSAGNPCYDFDLAVHSSTVILNSCIRFGLCPVIDLNNWNNRTVASGIDRISINQFISM